MPGADDEQAKAEIDMRRGPCLARPEVAGHPALAITQGGEPQDEQRPDGAERIAVPTAAIGARLDVDQRIADDDQQARAAQNLCPAKARIAQESLVPPLAHALGLGRPFTATLTEARHQPASCPRRALARHSSA